MAGLAIKRLKKRSRRPMSLGDRLFEYGNLIFLTLLMVVTLYPFLNTLAVSLNNANDSIRGGIYLLPRVWTMENYKYVLGEATIFHATLISVLRTDRKST